MAKKNSISGSDLPEVVIFGRTNVGKSTLFNRLTETHGALVSDIEGTTRDSNSREVEWRGKSFRLVDTGGILEPLLLAGSKKRTTGISDIDQQVIIRSGRHIKGAALVLFVVDAETGILPDDAALARLIKEQAVKNAPVLLVANKVDSPRKEPDTAAFNRLGIGEPLLVSAATGRGTGDLLDAVVEKLDRHKDLNAAASKIEPECRILIAGRPNVGKSSLLNALVGEERAIVSPFAHTTREPQDARILVEGRLIEFVDTAGISKQGMKSSRKAKDKHSLVSQGIDMSLAALGRSDIVLLVFDVTEPLTHQDAKIVEEIVSRGKSIILVANKWDLVKEKDVKRFTQYIYASLPFLAWAPIVFVSALTKQRIGGLLRQALLVKERRGLVIPEAKLKDFLLYAARKQKPLKGRGQKRPFIYSLKQYHSDPPKFEVLIGPRDSLDPTYLRFLQNGLRERFGFLGTPVKIVVKRRRKVHGRPDSKQNTGIS